MKKGSQALFGNVTRTRGNGHKLKSINFIWISERLQFLTIRQWNRLPRLVVEFLSVEMLEISMDMVLKNLFYLALLK